MPYYKDSRLNVGLCLFPRHNLAIWSHMWSLYQRIKNDKIVWALHQGLFRLEHYEGKIIFVWCQGMVFQWIWNQNDEVVVGMWGGGGSASRKCELDFLNLKDRDGKIH
jgi:hypothetical protein